MSTNATALTTLTGEQVNLILKNVDTTGMTAEDKMALAAVIAEDLEASRQGFDFRPQRYKINKDNQTFTDPFGNARDELNGVTLHKQKVRALWKQGENVPLCSSLDCVSGNSSSGNPSEKRPCSGCSFDVWGSGSLDNDERRGKACKEMRRVYLVEKDGFLPILVTLPPTSISPWDNFCSARSTQGISDLSAEVILRLVPGKTQSFTYSVIQPKNGGKIPPAEILRYYQMRQKFVGAWQKAEITTDDYETGDIISGSTEVPEEDVPF